MKKLKKIWRNSLICQVDKEMGLAQKIVGLFIFAMGLLVLIEAWGKNMPFVL